MKFKTHPSKLPKSIYILFVATILANALATFLVVRYL